MCFSAFSSKRYPARSIDSKCARLGIRARKSFSRREQDLVCFLIYMTVDINEVDKMTR